jgi:hypothetical protein
VCKFVAAGTEPQPPRAQQSDVQQAASGGRPPRVSFRTPSPCQSSWGAKEAGGGRSAESDYLSELGAAQQYNINVDHGQRAGMIDSLFTGSVLGHKTDIAGALPPRSERCALVHWCSRPPAAVV